MKPLFNRAAFLKEQTRVYVYTRRVIKRDIARQYKKVRRILVAIINELTERRGIISCAGGPLTLLKEHHRALDRLMDQYKEAISVYQQLLKDLTYIVTKERESRYEEAKSKPVN